ncbi:MAG: type II toxin-antitoxin system RelE/ParE family toxin [Spirochaetaceae bacterium]|nr:type II toxin-antitoxin system RelE/ParE family toxin [Spirochaetaceae bacterium]MCF7939860.1 type II toxin-antitoxin system RelE/ParE family toxin [Spirochaetales bacterium]
MQSNNYKIAETDGFIKTIEKSKYRRLYKKIKDYVYPLLKRNPFYGPNIKRLKGEYSYFYRFRIGDYRLFYTIDHDKIIIFIIDTRHRKDAYK